MQQTGYRSELVQLHLTNKNNLFNVEVKYYLPTFLTNNLM